jgi:hypothetical protein
MRYRTALTIVTLLSACSSVPPEWVAAPNRCTVLLGGGGTIFPNSALNDRWFFINKTLSTKFADALEAKGYRIERLIVDVRDNQTRVKAASAEMNRAGCNKVVQLAHSLSGTEQVADSFQFTVSILGVSPKGMAFTGEFEKTYKYALTKEVMETLSLSGLAAQMATDVEQAGILNKGTS